MLNKILIIVYLLCSLSISSAMADEQTLYQIKWSLWHMGVNAENSAYEDVFQMTQAMNMEEEQEELAEDGSDQEDDFYTEELLYAVELVDLNS